MALKIYDGISLKVHSVDDIGNAALTLITAHNRITQFGLTITESPNLDAEDKGCVARVS